MRLLIDDRSLMLGAFEESDWDIEELEIHLLNMNSISTSGINRLAVSFANTLTTLKITVLDHLCWHSVEGTFAFEVLSRS